MDIATSALIVIGAAVVLLGLFCLGLWALDAFDRRVMHPWRLRIEQAWHDHLIHRRIADSWWFSEDTATMNLLVNMARGLDVSEARERWRAEKNATAAPTGGQSSGSGQP